MEVLANNVEVANAGHDRERGHYQAKFGPALSVRRCVSKVTGLALMLVISVSITFAPDIEYQVKAAFLYNFAKFVEWPPEAFSNGRDGGGALVVGVIGDDPFGSAIDQAINGKTVNGRQLTIRRLKWGQNLKDCHVLFISSSERGRLPQILDSLKGANVLTVGEMDQFCQQGGIINFVMEEGKVRFEINTSAAEQARLRISAKLLALAKVIRGGKGAGKN